MTFSPTPTTCGGGTLATGFRNVTGIGEVTQFPNSWPSATYRNVEAPPAYNLTFAAGTYYWNAQMVAPGQLSGCAAPWSGTVTW